MFEIEEQLWRMGSTCHYHYQRVVPHVITGEMKKIGGLEFAPSMFFSYANGDAHRPLQM
jgi:hypothetical protein